MSGNFPYPGLRPFARDETDIFFGREEHTDQLLERLQHAKFLALVGPSGCGKSSLVRTGLLAGLETGLLTSAGAHWRVAEMRPGNRPFANLADALLVGSALGPEYIAHLTSYFTEPAETSAFLAEGSHHAMLQAQLRRGPFSLHEILAYTALPENTQLLILVDQFEEIFRYYQQGQEDEAAAFVSLLMASSQHPRVYILMTMRSDFLGDCALFHGLPEAINQGLFLTPRLNRDQLRASIEEPAGVFGGRVEPTLVNRLLNDTGSNPDQLPVLQHALMRMWTIASIQGSPPGGDDSDEGITLTMDHYATIGGLDSALSQHADEAYNDLTPAQQAIAEIMFRSLSERGSDRRDTRRPVLLREVADLAKVPWPEVAAVVEVFRQEGRSFLMPPAGADLSPGSLLDISHESLIRQWRRLQDWTTQEAESAELYQRLQDSACRWEQGRAALWRTPELENALTWRERANPTAEWATRYGQHFDLAMRFLDASAAQQREEEQQVEAVRQRELRQARRQVTMLGGGLILAGVLVLLAIFLWRHAEKSLKQTEMAELRAAASADEAVLAKKKAEENFQQARHVVEDFLTQLSDEKVKDVPGFQSVQKELMEVALKYYKGFIQEHGNDPSVQAELGRAYFQIGKITNNMGLHTEALKAYDDAAKIQQRLLDGSPDHPEYLSGLGLTYYSIGEIQMFADRPKEALQSFEKAYALQEYIISLYQNMDQYQAELANTLNRLGTTHTHLKNSDEAERWFNRNLEIYRQLVDRQPKEPKFQYELARSYNNISILHNQNGKDTLRFSSLQKSAEIIDILVRDHPNVQQYWALAIIIFSNLSDIEVRLVNLDSAKVSLQRSRDITARLIKENPLIPKYKEQLMSIYYSMVVTLQQQDKLEAAIASTQQLLEAKPDHANAWNVLGVFLSRQGKRDEAITAYQQQITVKPDHEWTWNNLGLVLRAQNRLDEAIAAFQQQVTVKPDHVDAWNSLGLVLRAQNRLDDAVTAYQQQVAVKPDHADAWDNLGLALQAQNKLDEAIAAFQQQVTVKPDHAWAWNNLGRAFYRYGKRDEAITAYQQQGTVKPDHAWAWNNLGLALRAQNRLDEAIAAFQQQVTVKPDHADAWDNLGLALQAQNKRDDAIAAYQQQITVKPDHADAWNNLGTVFQAQNKFDDAIAAYQQQIKVKPDHAWAWNNLGRAFYRQGKRDDAIAAFQQHVRVKSGHVDAWNEMGIFLLRQGDNDAAEAAFAKGLDEHPKNLTLLSNDAELALAQGDLARLYRRIDVALPQVTSGSQLFVILPFLTYLAHSDQGWANVMTAISKLDPGVKFTWDFSDTIRAITRLDGMTQQIAQHFIGFFQGRTDLPTLKALLAAN